jgi:glutathione S-transferase
MKLLYAPGACSIGIHVLLEEIGAPYEAQAINMKEKEQTQPAFTAINPKAKVPTLVRDDGSVLTEFPAIAYYLAGANPKAGLWPADLDSQVRVLETLDYVVATVHMQGFTRIARPENFAPASESESVTARGTEIFATGLALLEKALDGRDYLAGTYSIADAAMFYVEFWATRRTKLELPPNLAAHFQRMLARPAVQRVLKLEGFA